MAAVRSLHACGSRLKTLGASLPNHLGSQRGERYRRETERERETDIQMDRETETVVGRKGEARRSLSERG